ncbi:MAG: HD domain-containing phosphohydrolase, partial [Eubacteriales bacterium]
VRLFNNVQKSAQTDKLTGLYNRAYFEDNISKLCSKANMPLSLIIGDVNGLKITNDVFGHYEGDKLLLSIGNILHNVCGENNLIARWGGDEFIVVLPNTTEKNVELICNQINEECIKNSTLKLKISISMGHATMISTDENILHIIRNAEDRMYRNKLLDRNSFRSSFISSLKETLHENCQETEEHLDRMHKLAEKTGKILNLSENEISDLKLLALLHDVGKVAISDYIVNKPGELTREEWETMKNHTEIGYRIVQSSPDLAQIAHYILYHHERWDGKGYPSGKKGDEIPKLSRIISIIDAYDVMTHERKYKKPISHNKAIAELIRCSGTQFDPNLVAVFCNAFKKSD